MSLAAAPGPGVIHLGDNPGVVATIVAAQHGNPTVVDVARLLDLPELEVRAIAIRNGVHLPPPAPGRRPWEPETEHCGRIWHYLAGCGSDLCRDRARRQRQRWPRADRPGRIGPATAAQTRREVLHSLGMDA